MATEIQPLTVRLNNGREVLAKLYNGEPCAVTYSNRTQAYRRLLTMDRQLWDVYRFGGRPFYVGRNPEQPFSIPL